MLGRKIILAFCLIGFVSFGSRAQQPPGAKPANNSSRVPQPVPPPPKPADDGPSLEVTMKFIQDKMSDLGVVNWTERSVSKEFNRELGINFIAHELSNFTADPQLCRINFHRKTTRRQHSSVSGEESTGLPLEYDKSVDLKEVEKVQVATWESQKNSPASEWTVQVQPSVVVLNLLGRRKTYVALDVFYFDDEELANRLARAMTHAVELCTPDKKPEPF